MAGKKGNKWAEIQRWGAARGRRDPRNYNTFGYDPNGSLANACGLIFGDRWRPNPAYIERPQGVTPEPPRYGPPAPYQVPYLPQNFEVQYPYNGYYGTHAFAAHYGIPPPPPLPPSPPPMPPPPLPPMPPPLPLVPFPTPNIPNLWSTADPTGAHSPPRMPAPPSLIQYQPSARNMRSACIRMQSPRTAGNHFSSPSLGTGKSSSSNPGRDSSPGPSDVPTKVTSFHAMIECPHVTKAVLFPIDVGWLDFFDRVCAQLAIVPATAHIAYKLSNAKIRENPISLASEHDFDNALKCLIAHNAHANTRQPVAMHIINLDYLDELPIGKAKSTLAKRKRQDDRPLSDELADNTDLLHTQASKLKAALNCEKHHCACYVFPSLRGGEDMHHQLSKEVLSLWAKEWVLGRADPTHPPAGLLPDYKPPKRGRTGPGKAVEVPNPPQFQLKLVQHFESGTQPGPSSMVMSTSQASLSSPSPPSSPHPAPGGSGKSLVSTRSRSHKDPLVYPEISTVLEFMDGYMPGNDFVGMESSLRAAGIYHLDDIMRVRASDLAHYTHIPLHLISALYDQGVMQLQDWQSIGAFEAARKGNHGDDDISASGPLTQTAEQSTSDYTGPEPSGVKSEPATKKEADEIEERDSIEEADPIEEEVDQIQDSD